MTADDIPSILEIERDSQPEPWSRELFLEEIDRPQAQMLVARTVQAPPGGCFRNRLKSFSVVPTKAGIRESCAPVDFGLHRNDLSQTLSDRLLGYICFWQVAGEIQILNIAVHKAYRGLGLGRTLLRQALFYGYSIKAQVAVLEVRRNNAAARGLYESLGFKVIGERPNYYGLREAAIIMEFEFGAPSNEYMRIMHESFDRAGSDPI